MWFMLLGVAAWYLLFKRAGTPMPNYTGQGYYPSQAVMNLRVLQEDPRAEDEGWAVLHKIATQPVQLVLWTNNEIVARTLYGSVVLQPGDSVYLYTTPTMGILDSRSRRP